MHQNKISILSTRPLHLALINEAAQKNVSIDEKSFIEIEPINNPAIIQKISEVASQKAVVIFTSMNAVEIVCNILQTQKPDWKIYCIGNTTKALIQKHFGEKSIVGFANDASELAQVIVNNKETITTFFCGDKRRDELPEILNGKGIRVNEIIVYRTISTFHLLEKDYDGILFFSPSGVESFFKTNTIKEQTVLFAIGKTTAKEIGNYSNNAIVISEEPGKENLFWKMMNYYK